MDTSLQSVSPLWWIAGAVVGLVLLGIILAITAPFFDPLKNKDRPK